MKKIMYTCDRCGKEIEHPEELRAIYTHPNYSEEDHVREDSIPNDMDFCPECLEAIKFFATRKIPEAALKAAEPAKPKGRPGRKPGRKKIDAERAWQMYMQGVKVLDIAKEFDAQPSSIRTLLSKMRKERLDENGKIKENTEKMMKTKDLMEFLRRFDPDSEVNFLVAMLSQKVLFDLDEVNARAVHEKGAPTAPLFMLDVTKAVKMPDNMVQLWKSKLAEAKVQE